MVNKVAVYEALKRTGTPPLDTGGQDGLVSLLMHDLFGAEILKTHKNKSWHFYNRIDGERIDFTKTRKMTGISKFEDIPSNPDEFYYDQADYTTFFTRFIRAFEETVGLDQYRTGLSS